MRFLAALLMLLPALAHAEGGEEKLVCDFETVCDQDGDCERDSGRIFINIIPIKVGPRGTGAYKVAYDGGTYDAQKITGIGPFIWSEHRENMSALAHAAINRMVWHQINLKPPTTSTIRFMQCKGTS